MIGYILSAIGGYILASLITKREKVYNLHHNITQYHRNPVMAFYHTVITILKMKRDELHEIYVRALKQSRQISRNVYEVDYYHNRKKYRMRFSAKEGPPLLDVFNERGENISEYLYEYLGPSHDFHGKKYTPSDLGLTRITVLDANLQEKVFHSNELIVVQG